MRSTFRKLAAGAVLLAGILLAGGCATPVTVERVDHGTVHQHITRNVLSAQTLSDPTHNVLRRWALVDRFLEKPEYAIADLHKAVAEGRGGADEVFALAEMAFLHAENRGGRPYYLASALYAYAFLFPGTVDQPPSPYDPRFRLATDLYNRGLTTGLETEDRSGMAIQAATYRLPFGQLDVAFDRRELAWGGRQLTDFFPVAELEVDGLDARYRQPGIGAPLAAGTTQGTLAQGFQVGPRVKTVGWPECGDKRSCTRTSRTRPVQFQRARPPEAFYGYRQRPLLQRINGQGQNLPTPTAKEPPAYDAILAQVIVSMFGGLIGGSLAGFIVTWKRRGFGSLCNLGVSLVDVVIGGLLVQVHSGSGRPDRKAFGIGNDQEP